MENSRFLNGIAPVNGSPLTQGKKSDYVSAPYIKNIPTEDAGLLGYLDSLAVINRPFINHCRGSIKNCDGVIGDFRQGGTGDCWLLSGLKALSMTTKGSSAIKNALRKNPDGSCTVSLYGIGVSYTITPEEFEKAMLQKENIEDIDIDGRRFVTPMSKYSKGDADALLFELAIGKAREDMAQGKFDLTNIPNYGKVVVNPKHSIEGGQSAQVYNILTGRKCCEISTQDITTPDGKCLLKNNAEKLDEFLNRYFENNDKYAAGFDVGKRTAVKDIHGLDIYFAPKHEYAILGTINDNIVISDPHNSSVKIILSKENFKRVAGTLSYVNLEDNNDEFDRSNTDFLEKSITAENYINKNY